MLPLAGEQVQCGLSSLSSSENSSRSAQEELSSEQCCSSSSLSTAADANKRGRQVDSAQVNITSLKVNSKKTPPASVSDKQSNKRQDVELALRQSLKPEPQVKREKLALDPTSELYYYWSAIVSLAFVYNFWAISYRFSFDEIRSDSIVFWFALDYAADTIYLLDVLINLRTCYLEEGVLQRNLAKISRHYRDCTRFYVDCFCLLPLDMLYMSFGYNSLLRFPRLAKIYKFWHYTDRTERHTNYPNVYRTFTLVHYILVIFHWNACLFHMISKNKIIDIETLYKIDGNQCGDIMCQYLHAFYWSTLALTTVGDLPRPRTKGEYLYVTAELFFGLFLLASVLGHVANIVTNVSAARKEFQAKLDAVKTFMRMRRVSDELQSKVIRWFDYLWSSQRSSDDERSVACLPDRLKAELAIHVHLDTLKRVDIFQNTEAGFLCELVLRLKPVLFSPGDYVCRKNEVGHEMYIVSRGILEVVTNEGKTVVATLKAGSYFGEISVLNVGSAGNKRTASVRSVGYSDLFCLNKQDLWDVLKNYPNAEARIRTRAEERLSKLGYSKSKASGGQANCNSDAGLHQRARKWRSAHAPKQRASCSSRHWNAQNQRHDNRLCIVAATPRLTNCCCQRSNHNQVHSNGALGGHRRRLQSSAPVKRQSKEQEQLSLASRHQQRDWLMGARLAPACCSSSIELENGGCGRTFAPAAANCCPRLMRTSSSAAQRASRFNCSHSLQLPICGEPGELQRSTSGRLQCDSAANFEAAPSEIGRQQQSGRSNAATAGLASGNRRQAPNNTDTSSLQSATALSCFQEPAKGGDAAHADEMILQA